MSAGEELAGEGEAGDDDPDTSTEALRIRPSAIFFDGFTRDFPIGDDGRYVSIHPVDAAMQMACMFAKGTIAGSTTTGNELAGNEYLDPEHLDAKVRDAVRRCTARLVNNGDVTIDGVRNSTSDGGGLNVVVDYFNERLPGRPRKTAGG